MAMQQDRPVGGSAPGTVVEVLADLSGRGTPKPVRVDEAGEVLTPTTRLVPPRRSEPDREVRVSIVEDEGLTRTLLERTICDHPGLRVVHAVPGLEEARLAIEPGSTDVVLVDVTLGDGNGVSLGVALQRADPHLSVMLLSSQDHMGLFSAVRNEMVRPWSYLSKRSTFTPDVLTGAVIAVARGSVVIDPYLVRRSEPREGSAVAELTATQFQVLRLVAEGLSNQAVAECLDLSARSVESHLRGIYQRLELEDDAQNRRVAAVLEFLDQTGRRWTL
ncbi:MAG TPA: response regulator transcription factor [Cellulomonas sp.]